MQKIIELIKNNKKNILGLNAHTFNDLIDDGIIVKIKAASKVWNEDDTCYFVKDDNLKLSDETFFFIEVYKIDSNNADIEANESNLHYTIRGLITHQLAVTFYLEQEDLINVIESLNLGSTPSTINIVENECKDYDLLNTYVQLKLLEQTELIKLIKLYHECNIKPVLLKNGQYATYAGEDDFHYELYKLESGRTVIKCNGCFYSITPDGEANYPLSDEFQAA